MFCAFDDGFAFFASLVLHSPHLRADGGVPLRFSGVPFVLQLAHRPFTMDVGFLSVPEYFSTEGSAGTISAASSS